MFSTQSQFSSNSIFKLATDIVSRTNSDGTIVVMRLDGDNVFYKINGVAAEIWGELPKGESIGKIIKDISVRYKVDEKNIFNDSEKFLKELIDLKLASV